MPPTLGDIKEAFGKYIKLSSYELLDVVLGCAVANILEGDAVNLYVVGKSSSGKTEAIRLLEMWDKACFVDDLTTNTLVSGYREGSNKYAGILTAESKKGVCIFAIKEFASVLSMRSDDMRIVLGQIRQIADGKYSKPYGNSEKVVWEGKMAFLVGVTPAIDAHHSIIAALGERFIYYRLGLEDEFEIAKFAANISGKEKKLRKEAQKVTREFMVQFKPGMEIEEPEEWRNRLVSSAMFSVKARMAVSRNIGDGSLKFIPQSEAPYRIIKQLKTLAVGICLVRGKECLDDEVMVIINKVARDNIPEMRQKVLVSMYKNGMYGHGWTNIISISNCAKLPKGTVYKVLADLRAIEGSLVERMVQGSGEHFFRLTDFAVKLIKDSGIYD